MTREESASQLIDRLVLGQPRPEVLIQRAEALLAADWMLAEIAPLFAVSPDALMQRLSRHRRAVRG